LEGGGKSLTIPFGDKDNIVTLQLTPGYTKFHSFCNSTPAKNDSDLIIMYPATLISNDKGDEADNQVDNCDEERPETEKVVRKEGSPDVNTTYLSETIKPFATDFDLDGSNSEQIPEINFIEEDMQSTNLAAELLQIHHCVDHVLFSKLQERLSKVPLWQDSRIAQSNVHGLCIQKGKPKGMEGKAVEQGSKQPN
jgi:hypothetical protein